MSDHYHYEYAEKYHRHYDDAVRPDVPDRGSIGPDPEPIRELVAAHTGRFSARRGDESTVSGLREDLGRAEERIHELELGLRSAFDRIRALEEPPDGVDGPEERGVSEYHREEFALEHPEEPW